MFRFLYNILRYVKHNTFYFLFMLSLGWAERIAPISEIRALRKIERGPCSHFEELDDVGIAIFANRGWRIHKALEGVLGRALLERGHHVEAICGDCLPYSECFDEVLDGFELDIQQRYLSNYIQASFYQFGVPTSLLSEWLHSGEREKIRSRLDSHDGRWKNFHYQGYPIGEWGLTSVAWRLTGETIDESDQFTRSLYRKVVETGCVMVEACERYFEEREPEVVVLMNGIFIPERVVFELARERNIRVVTHEHGHHQNSFVFDHNKSSNYFNYDAEWQIRRETPLSDKERSRIASYLQQRAGASAKEVAVDYWPEISSDRDRIEDRLGTSLDKNTLVLFPNIVWDSAALKRDIAFDGLMDWIAESVEAMASISDKQLIIRAHPAEVRLGRRTTERVGKRLKGAFPGLPEDVYFIPPESDISSYALMEESEAVLVYTSTTGLEAAVRGIPTVVAGETHYRGEGWTIDIDTRDQYRRVLAEDLRDLAPSDEDCERALRYAHLFFFEGHIRLPFFDRPREGGVTNFLIDDMRELRPGRTQVLDELCEAVTKGRSFVYPGKCDKAARQEIDQGVFGGHPGNPEISVD
ncbi:capsular biosynthesis protein [Salinibacter ruber]|uniref:capsular biosynthesis protein n=1 Tax=Salinibacter ruber TaxID=146919 RepID=UPI00216819B1|nr:capsular biosynthesis protein [Salinibacter ruber]MCS3643322.1 hypothetical protein [Salinibacter ruber]